MIGRFLLFVTKAVALRLVCRSVVLWPDLWSCCLSQEYLEEEGRLSPEAQRMVADLLNDQSLMFMALTEVLYLIGDVSDNVR